MTDEPAWVKITCQRRDQIMLERRLVVISSLTDHVGAYGQPKVFSEWGDKETEAPVLRDVRWPNPKGREDVKPCEHYGHIQ